MYLIRLDDASANWNWDNWYKMQKILDKHSIFPIFGIIPKNEDELLLQFPEDNEFYKKIGNWIKKGWSPALHGFSHKYITSQGGINPVNDRSEFAGVPLEIQKEKIREGCRILKENKIMPKIFFAPSHTFDENTLVALREESEIRIISDTIANDIYFKEGFYFIPQQSGRVRKLRHKVTTFCYHPNFMNDSQFDELDNFLQKYKNKFISVEDLSFIDRKRSLYDLLLQKLYFLRRKIVKLVKR